MKAQIGLAISAAIIIFTFATNSSSQTFTKITSGDLITTLGYHNIPAWGDYDNDGDQDVVVSTLNDSCGTCPTPILFFENNGDGTFTKKTDNAISQLNIFGSGLSWGDFDNDNYVDLFVCGTIDSKNHLFRNNRNGTFTKITEGIVVNDVLAWSQGCAWADYNRDGKLDLFVANRFQANFLYKNEGNGNFTKITEGAIVTDVGSSRACAWGDYNNDKRLDLFVVNYDGISDFLYKNNGDGTFTKVTNVPMVNDNAWGSSCSWMDFDNSGTLDLLVTNTGSANRLYVNYGNEVFVSSLLLNTSSNSYGFSWGDYNNDGYTDLFLCNKGGVNSLYKNTGGSFVKELNEVPAWEGIWSVASSFVDYDNNGRLDLFVTNRFMNFHNYLYKNISTQGNYINIKVKACGGVASAIGTRLVVIAGGKKQMKEISSSTGWSSQSPHVAHFGLANASIIDTVIIYWQSDSISRHTNIQINQSISFNECPETPIGISSFDAVPEAFELSQNFPNPFNPSTTIKYALQKNSDVSLRVFDVNGKQITALVNEYQRAGHYEVRFESTGLPSGVYYYRINAGDFTSVRKMLLIK